MGVDLILGFIRYVRKKELEILPAFAIFVKVYI